jgi:hypothetical protein
MGWASHWRQNQVPAVNAHAPRPPRIQPKEDPRLSERLVDLIAPYCEDALTLRRYEMLIGAAASAWNLSLLPERERPEALREAVRTLSIDDANSVADLVEALMRRREELFPTDDRSIVSWEVSESSGQYHVTVLSEIPG